MRLMNIELLFCDHLHHFRERERLSERQLAERIQTSHNTISLWERGYYILMMTLVQRIATAVR